MIRRIGETCWVRVDIYGEHTRVTGPGDETPDKFPRDDAERCAACWLNHPHSQAVHQETVEYFVQQTARDAARWAVLREFK